MDMLIIDSTKGKDEDKEPIVHIGYDFLMVDQIRHLVLWNGSHFS